jgi:hypothetical protein
VLLYWFSAGVSDTEDLVYSQCLMHIHGVMVKQCKEVMGYSVQIGDNYLFYVTFNIVLLSLFCDKQLNDLLLIESLCLKISFIHSFSFCSSQLERRTPIGVSVITHTKTHGRTRLDE